MINGEDFQYMWRGKAIRALPKAEEKLLRPIKKVKKTQKTGRALVLIHGFSSSPAIYRALIPKLKHYDALFCPVLPGHGENLAAFMSTDHEAWREGIHNYVEPIIKDYPTVEVLGLSLGGLLSLELAQSLPIQRLYLLAPALKLTFNVPLAKTLAHVLHGCGMKTIKNKGGNLHMHEHDELTYKKLPIRTIIELFSMIQSHDFAIPSCKTDLFLGVHDEVVHSEKVAKYFEKAANCNIHWLDRSAHAIPLDGDIDTIAGYVNDYKMS